MEKQKQISDDCVCIGFYGIDVDCSIVEINCSVVYVKLV